MKSYIHALAISIGLISCSQRLHRSAQTEEIFALLSGERAICLIDKKHEVDAQITLESTCISSPVLSACIREIHQKNGNPNLSFTKPYIHPNVLPSPSFPTGRPHFKPLRRQARLYNFLEFPFAHLTYEKQQELLQVWIHELSHAQQLQDKGLVSFALWGYRDYRRRHRLVQDGGYATSTALVTQQVKTALCNTFHLDDRPRIYKKQQVVPLPYDSLYDIPGTLEYQAHHVESEQLIDEFIDLLAQKVDRESLAEMTMLLRFASGYFDKIHVLASSYHRYVLSHFFKDDYVCYQEHCEQYAIPIILGE